MAYYECINKDDNINIGDKFTVILTGSHNVTITATVCYIDKTTICLLGDINLGGADRTIQYTYAWNYNVIINNKEYIGICRIPTLEQIYSKCAGYMRDFSYWTSTFVKYPYHVNSDGSVYASTAAGDTFGTVPFIEITL